ncbi:MAG: hypothetical protein AAF384_05935 [Pseudomonadota bacterium]
MTIRRGVLVLLALLLGGCTQQIAIEMATELPEVVVQDSGVGLEVLFLPSFVEHVYHERSPERGEWRIASGNAQRKTFSQVLRTQFSPYSEVDVSNSPIASDLRITPLIEQMQFAMPSETGFEYFEAWVKYRVELNPRDGVIIPDWHVTAYGRIEPGRFTRDQEALEQALALALRDAGAKLATELTAYQPLARWLAARS